MDSPDRSAAQVLAFMHGPEGEPQNTKTEPSEPIQRRGDGNTSTEDGALATMQDNNERYGVVKIVWTAEEDQQLLQLVHELGPRRWSAIAAQLPGRVGKQCRERWHNHLCPTVNKDEWTEEDDQLIMQLVQQMGTKWSHIAKQLPGRTDNAIKNRWNSMMRKNLRRQLKEQGGDAVVMQMENVNILPTRKRGCSTSAEVATAAITAATVNAAAASAIAKGGRTAAARLRAQSRDVPRAIIAAHQLAQQMAHQLAAPVLAPPEATAPRRVVVATPVVPVLVTRIAPAPMPTSPMISGY